MSTQLKAQQGLTNLTPIKVIHILISLAIMVCFKFVPAAEPLTPLGVEVIGIFLGMLYGWLIANDSFWPSIFGLLFLGLSSYSTVPAVLRDGFGNSTVLLLFFFFAFTNIISAAGITEYIARWIVSRKVVQGRSADPDDLPGHVRAGHHGFLRCGHHGNFPPDQGDLPPLRR